MYSIFFRGSSLASRFFLTLFMGKFFTLEEIGAWGLVIALTTGIPACFGFGINYYVNRDISHLDPLRAARATLHRFFLGTLIYISLGMFGVFLFPDFIKSFFPSVCAPLLLSVLVLEAVGLDLHYSFVAQGRVETANLIIFLRTALWVYPYALYAFFNPAALNLNSILYSWLTSLVFLYGVLFFCALKSFGLEISNGFRLFLGKIFLIYPRALIVYASDVAIFFYAFLDRFVLESRFSASDLGVYVLCQTLSSAVYLLISASVIQGFAKAVIDKNSDVEQERILIQNATRRIFLMSLILGVIVYIFYEIYLVVLGKQELANSRSLFVVLLMVNFPKALGDLYSQYLYAKKLDSRWIVVNLSSLVLMVLILFISSIDGSLIYFASGLLGCSILSMSLKKRVAKL